MQKNNSKKLGQFSIDTKLDNMRSLQKKKKSQQYSKGYKAGKFSDKKTKVRRQTDSGPVAKNPLDNINKTLYSGQDINLKSFINGGHTGVIGKPKLKKAQKTFFDKISGTDFVSDVERSGSNVTLKGNYMKGKYNLSPTSTQLKSSGWGLDIPDNYIKVSETLYKAPKKKYEKEELEYDDKTRVRKSSYTPAEVYINPDTGKVSKFSKRKTYKSYDKWKDDDGDRFSQEKRKPFVNVEKEFYDTGLLKGSKTRTSFKEDTRDEREEDYRRDEDEFSIRLNKVREYASDGYLAKKQLYGDYVSSEDKYKDYSYGDKESLKNIDRKSYLADETIFGPQKKTSTRKVWKPKTMYKESERSGNVREKEEDSEAKLMSEQFFVGDTKIGELKYDTAKGRINNKTSFDRNQFQKVATDAYSEYGSQPSFYNELKEDATPTYKDETQYDYGLRSYYLYDPSTGKKTKKVFW